MLRFHQAFLAERIPPELSPGCCTRCDPCLYVTIVTGLTFPSSQVGLLSKDNTEQIPFAYKLFEASDNDSLADKFKMMFGRSVPIEFVGVWWVSWRFP